MLYKRKRGKRYMKKVEKEKPKNNFTKLTHKRGISLIVLIVTIASATKKHANNIFLKSNLKFKTNINIHLSYFLYYTNIYS